MGAVQIPDELERMIEQWVAEGWATTVTDLVQEALWRLLEDANAEHNDIELADLADAEEGRTITITTAVNGEPTSPH